MCAFPKGGVGWHRGKTKKDYPQLARSGKHKIGVSPPNKVDIDEDLLKEVYLTTNLSLRSISELFGCGRVTISNRLKKLGIYKEGVLRRPNFVWSDEKIEELRILYPDVTTEELAEYFDTTKVNVMKQANRFGIKKRVQSKDIIRHRDGKKFCNVCETWKPFSEFGKGPGNSTIPNLRSMCKKCSNIASKRSRRNNPESYRASYINSAHRRRARLSLGGVSGKYLLNLRQCFTSFGYCPICDNEVDGDYRVWSLDHVVPLVRGGQHEENNLIYMCNRCNSSKYTETLEEYCGMTVDDVFAKIEAYAYQMEEAV